MSKSYSGTYYYVQGDTKHKFYQGASYEMYSIYDTTQDIIKGNRKKYHLTVPKQTPYNNVTRPHLTNESTGEHIYIEKVFNGYVYRDVYGNIKIPITSERLMLNDIVSIKGILSASGY